MMIRRLALLVLLLGLSGCASVARIEAVKARFGKPPMRQR